MVFWAIIVFLLGVVGLFHEITEINFGVPIFAEAISIVLMLVSLGMLYTALRQNKKE